MLISAEMGNHGLLPHGHLEREGRERGMEGGMETDTERERRGEWGTGEREKEREEENGRWREGERERRESKGAINVLSGAGVSTQSLSTQTNQDISSLIGWENPFFKSIKYELKHVMRAPPTFLKSQDF